MILRTWAISDLDNLVKYGNNPNIAQNMTDAFPQPYTKEKAEFFINMANGHSPQRIFCIDAAGEAVGAIGIHPQEDIHKKNAELGYWLAEPFWGKGLMPEAVAAILVYGFKTFDITRIFARPYGQNIASQRVLKKAGFVLEATLEKTLYKNGEFMDELIYAVRK